MPPFYWRYMWSRWKTHTVLQFDIACLILEAVVEKSSVTGNYRDLNSGCVLFRSRWSHSSKIRLGSNYIAGIKDPKKPFNLEPRILRQLSHLGCELHFSPQKVQTSDTPCHPQEQGRMGCENGDLPTSMDMNLTTNPWQCTLVNSAHVCVWICS